MIKKRDKNATIVYYAIKENDLNLLKTLLSYYKDTKVLNEYLTDECDVISCYLFYLNYWNLKND